MTEEPDSYENQRLNVETPPKSAWSIVFVYCIRFFLMCTLTTASSAVFLWSAANCLLFSPTGGRMEYDCFRTMLKCNKFKPCLRLFVLVLCRYHVTSWKEWPRRISLNNVCNMILRRQSDFWGRAQQSGYLVAFFTSCCVDGVVFFNVLTVTIYFARSGGKI